ncbi:MAG TPA: glycosyltransferase family 4 protein [Acidimicrobiales bacterium]
MRIGLLAPPWLAVPPRAYGGTEAVVDAVARGLAAAGHDVLLWTVGESTCPVQRGWLYERARTREIGLVSVEVPHVLAAYLAFERWGAQIVHDHSIAGPVIAATRTTMPIVTTNHGRFDLEANATYRGCADRVAIVAISHDQASRADVPVAAVIHHGIDLARYEPGDGGGDEQGPYLVFLGRMTVEKGPHRAVRIARRAQTRLLIAAKMHSVDEQRFFRESVEPLLGDGVEYVGEVGHADKQRLVGGALALVNPLGWPEPFGLAMVESLACGTPVVATDVGSVRELIQDGVTGFVCRDDDEMVHRLQDIRRIDRRGCRRAAEARFSQERMVADHLALYERVLGGGTHRGGRLAGEAA